MEALAYWVAALAVLGLVAILANPSRLVMSAEGDAEASAAKAKAKARAEEVRRQSRRKKIQQSRRLAVQEREVLKEAAKRPVVPTPKVQQTKQRAKAAAPKKNVAAKQQAATAARAKAAAPKKSVPAKDVARAKPSDEERAAQPTSSVSTAAEAGAAAGQPTATARDEPAAGGAAVAGQVPVAKLEENGVSSGQAQSPRAEPESGSGGSVKRERVQGKRGGKASGGEQPAVAREKKGISTGANVVDRPAANKGSKREKTGRNSSAQAPDTGTAEDSWSSVDVSKMAVDFRAEMDALKKEVEKARHEIEKLQNSNNELQNYNKGLIEQKDSARVDFEKRIRALQQQVLEARSSAVAEQAALPGKSAGRKRKQWSAAKPVEERPSDMTVVPASDASDVATATDTAKTSEREPRSKREASASSPKSGASQKAQTDLRNEREAHANTKAALVLAEKTAAEGQAELSRVRKENHALRADLERAERAEAESGWELVTQESNGVESETTDVSDGPARLATAERERDEAKAELAKFQQQHASVSASARSALASAASTRDALAQAAEAISRHKESEKELRKRVADLEEGARQAAKSERRMPNKPRPNKPPQVSKAVAAASKEGGKKGQDLCGMSDIGGMSYFCVTMDHCQGRRDLLQAAMDAANATVDDDADDRKGGAGGLGKMLLSAGDKCLAILGHLPSGELHDKLPLRVWAEALASSVDGEILDIEDETCYIESKADADTEKFPLKMRETAINASFSLLREKGLVVDDDSEDDFGELAEAAGIEW